MTFSIYDASIPVYKQGLVTLSHLLDKLEEHAKAKNIPAENFLNAKLAIDMFDFKRQIQIACDFAKAGCSRLSGQEPPSHPDTETTIADLRARIKKVEALLATVTPEKLKGAEDRVIKFSTPHMSFEFTGTRFVTHWSLPNYFFHITTAYNILRHNGVEIGKKDFIGVTN
jgi:uncharacterized protein